MMGDGRRVQRVGDATAGGAYAEYNVLDPDGGLLTVVGFQHDTIPNVGFVGVTNESLLEMVIDRLECFQAGDFPCAENESALEACRTALNVLEIRTMNRVERGVEGEHEK